MRSKTWTHNTPAVSLLTCHSKYCKQEKENRKVGNDLTFTLFSGPVLAALCFFIHMQQIRHKTRGENTWMEHHLHTSQCLLSLSRWCLSDNRCLKERRGAWQKRLINRPSCKRQFQTHPAMFPTVSALF